MPSKHIPEDTWTELIMKNGGDANAALEDVKTASKVAAVLDVDVFEQVSKFIEYKDVGAAGFTVHCGKCGDEFDGGDLETAMDSYFTHFDGDCEEPGVEYERSDQ